MATLKRPDIITAIHDPNLFTPWFKDLKTWESWLVALKALYGLPMNRRERRVFESCTRRKKPPSHPVKEAWFVVGRRGGKSFITALIAVFLACFFDYSTYLAPGEVGTIMIIATDRKQARIIFRYIKALLEGIPMLSSMIVRATAESIELSNGIVLEIHTCSFKTTRGYTVLAAICEEIAFWQSDDSANPDKEILAAIRPAMVTIPSAMLICISSPYAQRGALYETYKNRFGQDDPSVLVWQAESRTMNPTIPQSVIDRAYEQDPASASAEYGAQFRQDIQGFLNPEWIDRAVIQGRYELPPVAGITYYAFCDPSGGGHDAFALAICHREGDRFVLDVCRGRRPPFSPDDVVAEYSGILQRYGIDSIRGDRYAGQWVVEAFAKHDIRYEHSEKDKSSLYLETEPLFATGKVDLLDNKTLLTELVRLERRTASGGRDRVDHPPQGYDDLANSVCGSFYLCSGEESSGNFIFIIEPGSSDVDELEDSGEPVFRLRRPRLEHMIATGEIPKEDPVFDDFDDDDDQDSGDYGWLSNLIRGRRG